MAARIVLAYSSLALLAACATAQENPNYQFSSKYQGPGGTAASAPVQLATYETAPAVQDIAVIQSAPAPQPEPLSAPVSETEQAYDAATMTGTPGYEIMMAETDAPQAAPALPPLAGAPVEIESQRPVGARPVAYDYSQNVIIADAPTAIEPVEIRERGLGATHVVQPGDTVYNISRRLCVGVADVQAAGGIGPDYAIAIGQVLNVPESRC